MCKPVIEIKNIPIGLPSTLLQNGRLYLDLSKDFSFSFSKSVQESSDLSGIKTEGVLNFASPFTPTNNAAYRQFTDPSILNQDLSAVDVCVRIGSCYLQESYLCPVSITEQSRSYENQLSKGSNHWKEAMQDCLIKDLLKDETFDFTEANILDNWQNNQVYQNGGDIVNFAPVDYGGTAKPDELNCEDLRPLVSAWGLLKKCFCKTGFRVKSPFFESDYGRRLWLYMLREDFTEYEDSGTLVNYNVGTASDLTISALVNTEITLALSSESPLPFSDTGNNYDNSAFKYCFPDVCTSLMDVKISGSVQITTPVALTTATATIKLIHEDSGGTILSTEDLIIGVVGGTVVDIDVCIEKSLAMQTGDKVYVSVQSDTTGIFPLAIVFREGFSISGTVTSPFIYQGDILNIGQMVDQELTCFDLFEALVKAFNIKISEDEATCTVCLDIPHEKLISAGIRETVTGFYKPLSEAIDLTNKIICNTRSITTNKSQAARYVRVQYKDSTDSYIDSQNFTKENPPWSRTIDLGQGLTDETEVCANPLIEPTIDRQADWGTINGVIVPVMSDNDDGDISTNIGVRILLAHGYGCQFVVAGGTTKNSFMFKGVETFDFPILSQCTEVVNNTGTNPNINNVYSEKEQSMYDCTYKQEFLERLYSYPIQFLMCMTLQDYKSYDFRAPAKIHYNGKPVYYRMQEIKDFIACSGLPTPVTFVPVLNRTDLCPVVEIEVCDLCYTSPDPTGSNVFFSPAGNVNGYYGATITNLQTDIENYLTSNGYTFGSVVVLSNQFELIYDVKILGTDLPTGTISIIYEDFASTSTEVKTNCVIQ